MATLSQQIVALARRMGAECKVLHEQIGNLNDLTVEQKTNLVAAINAVYGAVSTLSSRVTANEGSITTLQSDVDAAEAAIERLERQIIAHSEIDDSDPTATDKAYSAAKVEARVSEAKQEVKDDILGGAGAAYDTLKELADLIATSADEIEAIKQIAAGHVKFDEAQDLTAEQKATARTNIGAASAADLNALSTAVGDTDTNFVTYFEAALEGNTIVEPGASYVEEEFVDP